MDLRNARVYSLLYAWSVVIPSRFLRNSYICLLDLASSKVEFEQMLTQDPWRIDNIDVYSFALHVTHNAQKLSRLSREYLLLAKDRPEVCSLVGSSIIH